MVVDIVGIAHPAFADHIFCTHHSPVGTDVSDRWRMLRPGLLPLWAGLPMGLFDDMYSGQPLGSGILLFSLTLIALDLIELRFPWSG